MPEEWSLLTRKIASRIVEAIASGGLAPGAHLGAQSVADRFGVSRSPARQALQLLAGQGYLRREVNRGFFVREAGEGGAPRAPDGEARPFDPPNEYQRLADDWLANRIPSEVTEQTLRSRYGLTKSEVTGILLRASREGWAERKPGYGWRFLPVAKTPEAFEQIYRFRMLIEPAAMLEPTFRIDPVVLARQREIQTRMLDRDIERLSGERLLENGAMFHEELIKLSGNPFFHQALVRVNRMRRLMEYRSRVDRRRLETQCAQHLEIIGLLERGEAAEASDLMRRHLGGALAIKSPVAAPAPEAARLSAE